MKIKGLRKTNAKILFNLLLLSSALLLLLTLTAGATDLILNGSFISDLSSWTFIPTLGTPLAQWNSSGYANGGCAEIYWTGKNIDASGYLEQSINISSIPSSAYLSFAWRKTWVSKAAATQNISVTIVNPSNVETTVWSDTTIYQDSAWQTVTNLDASSIFTQAGTYKIRLAAVGKTGALASSEIHFFFDEVKLDVSYGAAVTIGDGLAKPSSRTIGPDSSTYQSVDAFTLKTSSGVDTVTAVAVTAEGSTNVADITSVKIYQSADGVWDAADTYLGSGSFLASTITTITVSPISVTTTEVNYIIVYDVTADSSTDGHIIKGKVSNVITSSGNPASNSDLADATLTIDGMPPGTVTGFNATDGENRQSTLTWTNPADADFAGLRIMRRNDGLWPTGPNDPDAQIVFEDFSSPIATSYVDTGLTNGQTYYYVAYTKDIYGN